MKPIEEIVLLEKVNVPDILTVLPAGAEDGANRYFEFGTNAKDWLKVDEVAYAIPPVPSVEKEQLKSVSV